MSVVRSRWAAIGAAVAVSLGAGGGLGLVHAAVSSGARPVFIPITPCRILDTRPTSQVGPRSTPLGPGDVHTVTGRGRTGNCTIPGDAIAISLNVTAVAATTLTYLTIWPTGATRPTASSLNPAPGEPPTPNAVTTDLSAGGHFDIYNLQGNVHVLADVNGYYVDHTHDDRYYTSAQTDTALAAKADSAAVYTKTETYTRTEADAAINRVVSILTGPTITLTVERVFPTSDVIVTPIDGRLLITKPLGFVGISCSAPAAINYFLTLDGAPIASTVQTTGNTSLSPAVFMGTTAVIAAGTHTVGVAAECAGAATANAGSSSGVPGALNVLILN